MGGGVAGRPAAVSVGRTSRRGAVWAGECVGLSVGKRGRKYSCLRGDVALGVSTHAHTCSAQNKKIKVVQRVRRRRRRRRWRLTARRVSQAGCPAPRSSACGATPPNLSPARGGGGCSRTLIAGRHHHLCQQSQGSRGGFPPRGTHATLHSGHCLGRSRHSRRLRQCVRPG